MLPVIASQQSQLHAFVAVLAVGAAIGVFGHIIRSRTLIVLGIAIVGGVSVYFSFVAQPH
ncbi:MAG: hypothetical protein ACRDMJ_06395 [Solirubrobacteraceae bacterium]